MGHVTWLKKNGHERRSKKKGRQEDLILRPSQKEEVKGVLPSTK